MVDHSPGAGFTSPNPITDQRKTGRAGKIILRDGAKLSQSISKHWREEELKHPKNGK